MREAWRQTLQTIDGRRWLLLPAEATFLPDVVLVRRHDDRLIIEADKATGLLQTLSGLEAIAEHLEPAPDALPDPFEFPD
jgi:virulence-associated protein VagC